MKFSLRPATPEPPSPLPAQAHAELTAYAAMTAAQSPLNRFAAAVFIVSAELHAQARRRPEMRDTHLIDLCLDLRNALDPLPPLPDEPSVPVIPGRS